MCMREAKVKVRKIEDVRSSTEDGGSSCKPKNAGGLLEAGKDKETGFPLDPPKETQPCLPLDLRLPEL